MNENRLTGIILSGGKSSRMGKEKGLVDFQAKPLISYAIEVLKPISDSIIIGANNELETYKKFGYHMVEDEVKGVGPIGGLLSTLKYSSGERNFVISCDMPFINSELLNFLFQNLQDLDVVVAMHDVDKIEPLCGVYSKRIIPVIQTAIENGQYKLLDLFDKVHFKPVMIDKALPFYSDNLFYNINRPEDIKTHIR
jgi:molybdopterin-guanine dinucleotide biosynthesis protein A